MTQNSYDVTSISGPPENIRKINDSNATPVRIYKERWLVVIVVSILQIVTNCIWISYPSIANIAASYYNVSVSTINWLTEVSFIVYVISVFPTMWLVKVHGIKNVVYATSGCSAVGTTIRLFGTFNFVPQNYRFPITLLGQTICAITFPLLMTLPTQVSQSWFPEKQRALSTSITSMSSNIGNLLGLLLSPYLSPTPSALYIMNDSFCIPTIVLGSLGFLMRRSQPPTPPYAIGPQEMQTNSPQSSFIQDIKMILRNRHALLLALAGGGVFGALLSISLTLLQQLLCPSGYSNQFVANCGALITGLGFVFSLVFSYIVGRAKVLEVAVKISLAVMLLLGITLVLIVRIPNIKIWIAAVAVLLGMTAIGAAPLCMELTVEACYPVNEGMSGTIYWISCQIQAAIFIPLMTRFAQPLTPRQHQYQTCTVGNSVEAYDLTYPSLVLLAILTIEMIAVFLWCHPKYKRIEAENLTSKLRQAVPNLKSQTQNTEDVERF